MDRTHTGGSPCPPLASPPPQARSHGGRGGGAQPPWKNVSPPPLGCAVPFAVTIGIEVYPPPWNSVSPPANDTWLRRCPPPEFEGGGSDVYICFARIDMGNCIAIKWDPMRSRLSATGGRECYYVKRLHAHSTLGCPCTRLREARGGGNIIWPNLHMCSTVVDCAMLSIEQIKFRLFLHVNTAYTIYSIKITWPKYA